MRVLLGAVAVTLGSGAWASATMVVTASGDCRDADLVADTKLLSDALRARVGAGLIAPEQVSQRLGAEAGRSVDELQRQVEVAQTEFYQGDHAKAERAVDEALAQIDRLPPGEERWKVTTSAALLKSAIDRDRGRAAQADDAFRRVLRLDPDFQLDPDYFSPSARKHFDRIRVELKLAKRAPLAIRSTPSAADVFLDGKKMGQTPFTASLVPGSYQVMVASGGTTSLPHAVTVKEEAALHIDLKFEGAVQGRGLPCVADDGDERSRLANAVKLATVVGADQAIVIRLERQQTRPGWFAALMVNTATAQKVREGGLKVDVQGRPPDGLDELADFIVTGQPSRKVLSEPPRPELAVAAPPLDAPAAVRAGPPVEALPAITSAGVPRAEHSWKTTTGYVLGGVGLVAVAGAAYFANDSSQAWSSFNGYYTGTSGAATTDQIPAAQKLQRRAQTDAILAWTGAGVAAAALGAGAFLVLTDHAPGSGGGWALVPQPGGAALVGRLP